MLIKKFIRSPKSLFARFLLIIIIPTLVVQVVSVYVFFYSHIDAVSKHMARSVISEMLFIKKSVNNPLYDSLLTDFSQNIDLGFSFEEKRKLKKKAKIADSDWKRNKVYKYINLFPIIDSMNRFKLELENAKLTPYEIYENPDDEDFIIVKVQTSKGIISFDVPIKRINSSSKYVFIFWMMTTSIITSLVSILFLKNQMRSIKSLSETAEKFGRGQDVKDFKPSGSKEIRSVAISFVKMRDRIARQVAQRTDMLSAVSHDLRTPLTRMKLQLAMTKNTPEIDELNQDILDMEKLIDEYLDFARSDEREKLQPVMLKEFLEKHIIKFYKRMGKDLNAELKIENREVMLKKIAFKRAIINLIDNGFHYAKNVVFTALERKNNIMIFVDDDGPGIPKEEVENVFKPFYRIDSSRNLDDRVARDGSGLGMAIALDAITSHGGKIKLSRSALGGLRVTVIIPV
jgi:two-component system osmolarity sensor histidine kinase EnvZ